jgi:hypothetical protein
MHIFVNFTRYLSVVDRYRCWAIYRKISGPIKKNNTILWKYTFFLNIYLQELI